MPRNPEEIRARMQAAMHRAGADLLTPTATTRWWLSFATEGQCLGVVIVLAPDFEAAIARTHLLGINPGGEVAGHGFTPEALAQLPDQDRVKFAALPLDHLLSYEVLEAAGVVKPRDKGLT